MTAGGDRTLSLSFEVAKTQPAWPRELPLCNIAMSCGAGEYDNAKIVYVIRLRGSISRGPGTIVTQAISSGPMRKSFNNALAFGVFFVVAGQLYPSTTNPYFQTGRAVAITIDDLPGVSVGPETDAFDKMTDGILDALRRHDVPGIGFVNESKLYVDGVLQDDKVALLRRWLDNDHLLGNHTFSHRRLYDTPTAEYLQDVVDGEYITRRVVESTGKTLRYFRHPFLNTGRSLEQKRELESFLAERGYTVAPVTIDNYDYEFALAYANALADGDSARATRIGETYIDYMTGIFDYYETQSRLILQYEPRQVLLIHANRLNADWLDSLLTMIAERGYSFIDLDEALRDDAYQSPDTVITRFGFSWLHRWAITADMDRTIFRGEPEVPAWIGSNSN